MNTDEASGKSTTSESNAPHESEVAAPTKSEQGQVPSQDQNYPQSNLKIRIANRLWRWRRHCRPERLAAIFTFGILAVTATYTHYAREQVKLLRGSVDEVARQTPELIRSANAAAATARAVTEQSKAAVAQANAALSAVQEAQRANELAGDAVALTREQVHTGQRAYLLIKDLHLRNRPMALEVDTPMWFEWTLLNVGDTTARNPKTHMLFEIRPSNQPPEPNAAKTRGPTFVGGGALGPGDHEPSPDTGAVWLGYKTGRNWTPDDDARVQNGRSGAPYRLWVQLTVEYETVFSGVGGETTLCAYWESSQFSLCGTEVD